MFTRRKFEDAWRRRHEWYRFFQLLIGLPAAAAIPICALAAAWVKEQSGGEQYAGAGWMITGVIAMFIVMAAMSWPLPSPLPPWPANLFAPRKADADAASDAIERMEKARDY